MNLLLSWLLLVAIQLGATISPGPAFLVGIRNAILYGKGVGVATGIGLGLGVAVHILVVFTGISILVAKYALVYNTIKYVGAAYLIYIGVKCLYSGYKSFNSANEINLGIKNKGVRKKTKTHNQALVEGFFTNLLNPKAVLFFSSVFSQFITPETPVFFMVILGLTSIIIESGWYVIASFLLTNKSIQAKFFSITHWIDVIFGFLILFLAIKLAMHIGPMGT